MHRPKIALDNEERENANKEKQSDAAFFQCFVPSIPPEIIIGYR